MPDLLAANCRVSSRVSSFAISPAGLVREIIGRIDDAFAAVRNVATCPFRRIGRSPVWSLLGGYCCKSRFALVVGYSAGRRCDFRVKMWGASSSHVKLTGDLANVSEAIRIGDCFPFRNFAKNQSPCNFRLLQQYPPESDRLLRCHETALWASNGLMQRNIHANEIPAHGPELCRL